MSPLLQTRKPRERHRNAATRELLPCPGSESPVFSVLAIALGSSHPPRPSGQYVPTGQNQRGGHHITSTLRRSQETWAKTQRPQPPRAESCRLAIRHGYFYLSQQIHHLLRLILLASCHSRLLSCQSLLFSTDTKFAGHSNCLSCKPLEGWRLRGPLANDYERKVSGPLASEV